MKKILIILAIMFCASSAQAATKSLHATLDLETLYPDTALNGVVGTRTFSLPTNSGLGYGTLLLWVNYTHAQDGTLDVTCTGGPASNDKDYTLTTCGVANGTCTIKFGGKAITETLSANKKYMIRFGIKGAKDVQCIITHSAPTANDKAEIKGYLTTD